MTDTDDDRLPYAYIKRDTLYLYLQGCLRCLYRAYPPAEAYGNIDANHEALAERPEEYLMSAVCHVALAGARDSAVAAHWRAQAQAVLARHPWPELVGHLPNVEVRELLADLQRAGLDPGDGQAGVRGVPDAPRAPDPEPVPASAWYRRTQDRVMAAYFEACLADGGTALRTDMLDAIAHAQVDSAGGERDALLGALVLYCLNGGWDGQRHARLRSRIEAALAQHSIEQLLAGGDGEDRSRLLGEMRLLGLLP